MKDLHKLIDCLTMVSAKFGRVASTGLPSADDNDWHFAFADDGFPNYVCAIDYSRGDIKAILYLDFVLLHGLEGNARQNKASQKTLATLYQLGGELSAAGFHVEYK